MKKYLTLMTASSLISASLMGAADFYMGYELSSMTAGNAANNDRKGLDENVQGIGFGLRLYTDVNPDLDIGGDFGIGFVESRPEYSGSIVYAQFLLKYHLSTEIELFGGLGVAGRGTPSDTNTSTPSDVSLIAGMGSFGISYVIEGGLRFDATYKYIPFSGKIDAVDETVSTSLFGLHMGKTFQID